MSRQVFYQNKKLFFQWLVGYTEGEGTFSINFHNGKWSLAYKLSQHAYNIRLLYLIKNQLGVGNIKKESKFNIINYIITDRKILIEIIFPIFDIYPLLTSKYYYYLIFKEAYKILDNNNLTLFQQNELMLNLINRTPVNFENYISPAWKKLNNIVLNSNEAKKVISKAWLVGFIEAKGNFHILNISKDRIVHCFELNQILESIVLYAISYILGIKTNKTYHNIVTKNSRSIDNIVKYFHNTIKGMKSFDYRVWARSYVKYKGNYNKINEPPAGQ